MSPPKLLRLFIKKTLAFPKLFRRNFICDFGDTQGYFLSIFVASRVQTNPQSQKRLSCSILGIHFVHSPLALALTPPEPPPGSGAGVCLPRHWHPSAMVACVARSRLPAASTQHVPRDSLRQFYQSFILTGILLHLKPRKRPAGWKKKSARWGVRPVARLDLADTPKGKTLSRVGFG